MPTYRFLRTILVGALALSSTACSSTSSCDRDEELIQVTKDQGIVTGNTYYSSEFGGPYLYFPPARTLNIDISGLGAPEGTIPLVQFWLAFTAGGILAPSAGNITELRVADNDIDVGTDPHKKTLALNDHRISVYNNTCSDFYLWVAASRPSP